MERPTETERRKDRTQLGPVLLCAALAVSVPDDETVSGGWRSGRRSGARHALELLEGRGPDVRAEAGVGSVGR